MEFFFQKKLEKIYRLLSTVTTKTTGIAGVDHQRYQGIRERWGVEIHDHHIEFVGTLGNLPFLVLLLLLLLVVVVVVEVEHGNVVVGILPLVELRGRRAIPLVGVIPFVVFVGVLFPLIGVIPFVVLVGVLIPLIGTIPLVVLVGVLLVFLLLVIVAIGFDAGLDAITITRPFLIGAVALAALDFVELGLVIVTQVGILVGGVGMVVAMSFHQLIGPVQRIIATAQLLKRPLFLGILEVLRNVFHGYILVLLLLLSFFLLSSWPEALFLSVLYHDE